jgi:hypothetical protein
MTQPLNDHHDRFFRETFSRREVAEGFLRGYLPPAVVEAIAWDTLGNRQRQLHRKSPAPPLLRPALHCPPSRQGN